VEETPLFLGFYFDFSNRGIKFKGGFGLTYN